MCFITTLTAVCAKDRTSSLRVPERTVPDEGEDLAVRGAQPVGERAVELAAPLAGQFPDPALLLGAGLVGQGYAELGGDLPDQRVEAMMVGGQLRADLLDPLVGGVVAGQLPGRALPEAGLANLHQKLPVGRADHAETGHGPAVGQLVATYPAPVTAAGTTRGGVSGALVAAVSRARSDGTSSTAPTIAASSAHHGHRPPRASQLVPAALRCSELISTRIRCRCWSTPAGPRLARRRVA